MKTVGELIKIARLKKKISFAKLANITRIKEEFVVALEKESWNVLPEYPVVVGFVKNIAKALDISENTAVALLRRDYPKKDLPINPKPDVLKEFVWSPRLTFLLGIVLVFIGVFGYLIFQYISFITPPDLSLNVPTENQIVESKNLKVSGKTDPDATLRINNQPVLLNESGVFEEEIEVFEGTKEIVVVSKSRSGKETVVTRKIEVKLEEK